MTPGNLQQCGGAKSSKTSQIVLADERKSRTCFKEYLFPREEVFLY
jgi:hypothetical protein